MKNYRGWDVSFVMSEQKYEAMKPGERVVLTAPNAAQIEREVDKFIEQRQTAQQPRTIKNPAWMQNTPKDQFNVILWSLEGHISNIEDDIPINRKAIQHELGQLRQLGEFLKPSWS